MTLQRTTDGPSSAPTREQAEPIAIRNQRAIFESYPPAEQERIRERVRAQLRKEAHGREFQARGKNDRRVGSELARMALAVYGIASDE